MSPKQREQQLRRIRRSRLVKQASKRSNQSIELVISSTYTTPKKGTPKETPTVKKATNKKERLYTTTLDDGDMTRRIVKRYVTVPVDVLNDDERLKSVLRKELKSRVTKFMKGKANNVRHHYQFFTGRVVNRHAGLLRADATASQVVRVPSTSKQARRKGRETQEHRVRTLAVNKIIDATSTDALIPVFEHGGTSTGAWKRRQEREVKRRERERLKAERRSDRETKHAPTPEETEHKGKYTVKRIVKPPQIYKPSKVKIERTKSGRFIAVKQTKGKRR